MLASLDFSNTTASTLQSNYLEEGKASRKIQYYDHDVLGNYILIIYNESLSQPIPLTHPTQSNFSKETGLMKCLDSGKF